MRLNHNKLMLLPLSAGQQNENQNNATTVTAISAVPTHPKRVSTGLAATHHRKARNDHHHYRHDRNSDNAIEHGAPNQHLDGIDVDKVRLESLRRPSKLMASRLPPGAPL
jgi:hypothetical protein